MHWEDTPLDGFGREPLPPDTAPPPDSHDVRWADAGLDAPPPPQPSTSTPAPAASTSYTHALQRFVRCVEPPDLSSHPAPRPRAALEVPHPTHARADAVGVGRCLCRVASVSARLVRNTNSRHPLCGLARAERVRRGSRDDCGCRGTAQLNAALAHELQAAETAQTAQLRCACASPCGPAECTTCVLWAFACESCGESSLFACAVGVTQLEDEAGVFPLVGVAQDLNTGSAMGSSHRMRTSHVQVDVPRAALKPCALERPPRRQNRLRSAEVVHLLNAPCRLCCAREG